jgi:hypothetical protein
VGRGLVRFLNWVLTEGQQSSVELHNTPLPEEMRNNALETVATIRTETAKVTQ